LMLEKTKG